MNRLLKPISLFRTYALQDLADKTSNTIFGVLEFICIIVFFSIPVVTPHQPLFFLFFLGCSVCISFFINFMLSCVGFWTPEIWAPRFLFLMIVFFISGTYFPLDLLPEPLYRILLFTPFPYLYYLPTKTLVDGIQPQYIIQQIVCAVVWVYGTYKLTRLIWNKGIREFSFWGR